MPNLFRHLTGYSDLSDLQFIYNFLLTTYAYEMPK